MRLVPDLKITNKSTKNRKVMGMKKIWKKDSHRPYPRPCSVWTNLRRRLRRRKTTTRTTTTTTVIAATTTIATIVIGKPV